MSNPFRLGFLTRIEGTGESRPLYYETLELFKKADALGFDVAWIAEHHFKDLAGRLPSVFPFLGAASQCTTRLRLGTAVAILPFQNPLRVAEDAAVVDVLSGGRVELGVGSGIDPNEFSAFGVDPAERLQRTTDGLKMLMRALRGEPLGNGNLRLNPAAPGLSERIWQSGQSLVGAQHVARAGSGLLLSKSIIGPSTGEPTDVQQLPTVKAYVQAYHEAWGDAPGKPRIGMSRGIYPARDKKTALAQIREDVLRVANSPTSLFPAGESLESYCQRMHLFYGHPEEIAEGLRADVIFPYATDLILQYSPVTVALDEGLRILEDMALHIAPALGWQAQRVEAAGVPSPA